MGAQSSFTPELAAKICDRLSKGESLRSVCRDLHMPHESTVRGWARDDIEGFATHYARARDLGLEAMAEELLDIADDGKNDYIETELGGGITVSRADHEHINRSRLRVDTRKWYLSKLAPKRYGERLGMELTGAGGGPVEVKNDIDRAILIRALLGEVGQSLLRQGAAGESDMDPTPEQQAAASGLY